MSSGKSWPELLEESLPRHSPVMFAKLKDWHLNIDRQAKVIASNLAKFKTLPGRKLLDFGCGEGGIAVYFAGQGLEAWAADLQDGQLERTRIRAGESGVQVKTIKLTGRGIAEALEDRQFDFVICHDVIEHCAAVETTLTEIRRLLREDGLVYLTTPNRFAPGWLLSDPHYQLPLVSILPKAAGNWMAKKFRGMDNDVVRLYNPVSLSRLFKKHGLAVIYSYPDELRSKVEGRREISSPAKRLTFLLLKKLGLARLVLILLPVLHLFSASLIYILKPEA